MNMKKQSYIYAIASLMLALSACDAETNLFSEDDYTISGTGEKTPLEIAVTIKDSYTGSATRALDGKFEQNDELKAFVQQVKSDNSSYTDVGTGAALVSQLVTFTVGAAGNGQQTVTSDNLGTTLYWDDFSNTNDDITKSDRYLRVGYGFCFNGGTPSPSLDAANATVGWTVQSDQSDAQGSAASANVRKSDLLWAGPQTPVQYDHDHVRPGDENIVKLPVTYTHAMSKVTIELVLDEGFKKNTNGKAIAFGSNNTTPILFANKTASEVDAINQTIKTTEISGDAAKITMRLADDETTAMHRIYEAIIAPTVMKAGNVLATVEVDDNKYELKLTDDLLKTLPTNKSGAAWSSQLSGYDNTTTPETVVKATGSYNATDGGLTQPGINYYLIATLKKQRIEVEAKILPWNPVYAEGDGTISFDADVAQNGNLDTNLTDVTAGSFDLWRATSDVESSYDYDTTTDGINKASTYVYSGDKWQAKSGDNVLYWENQSTSYYFRALAKATSYAEGKVSEISTVDGSTSVSQSNTKSETVDLLWAQTSYHKGLDANGSAIIDTQTGDPKVYDAGEAIDPRTGNVPLTFKHAMSKITVKLETSTVVEEKVNLTDATISIINLYNGGTIRVSDGKISNLTAPDTQNGGDPMTVKGIAVADMKDYLVIPQSLTSLEDGTERTSTPVFYSADQLTAIYPGADSRYGDVSKNSSIGTGTATYYLTNELTPVPAVYYDSEITEDVAYIYSQNALLDGAVSTSTVKEPVVTQVDYDYAGFVTDKKHQSFTQEQFALLTDIYENARLKRPYQPAVDYSYTELHSIIENDQSKYVQLPAAIKAKQYTLYEYNELHKSDEGFTALTEDQYASLPDKDKRNENDLYSVSEFIGATGELQALFESRFNDSSIDGSYKIKSSAQPAEYYDYDAYIALESITNDMFTALPAELKIKIPHKDAVYYTQDEADEYNANLPGAIHVGDIKIPAHYVLPTGTTLTPHAPGSLQTIGNKIMLYVFLQDGTRYSAELSKCLETTGTDTEGNTTYGQAVEEWKSNHHYTYTITLAKEKISFRALVKEWEEKHVGGNATLDW